MDKLQLKDILAKELTETKIIVDEPMKNHTSFKVGGNADIFISIHNLEELKTVIKVAKKLQVPVTVIGNGSNLLVKDKGIRGIVLKICFEDIQIEKKQDAVYVTAGAGVKMGMLAQKLLKENIAGFEFAAGIPGTIGGAVYMNAGAHGKEMKDIVTKTVCLDIQQYQLYVSNIDDVELDSLETAKQKLAIKTLNNEEQEFSYRHSVFSDKPYIILQTILKLQEGKSQEIKEKMDEYLHTRLEKQPVEMPSAGSTFKRGNGYITAQLIDKCGLKGYTIGGAQVSEKHAGFIVNKGNATAEDILNLVEYIQKVVYEKTGETIQLEIEVLGE